MVTCKANLDYIRSIKKGEEERRGRGRKNGLDMTMQHVNHSLPSASAWEREFLILPLLPLLLKACLKSSNLKVL